MSKTLLFFGNERLSAGFEPHGAPTLQALIKGGYDIKAVIAHHSETHSRTQRKLEIEAVANAHNIPVLLPTNPQDIQEELAGYKAEAAVLVAYGKIIPQSLIDLFPRSIINIHPSLLPLYRGSTPIEQAMCDGASKTGVSLMQLTSGMDQGPVFTQEEVTLNGTETKQELTTQLLNIGAMLLIQHLPAILDGSLIPKAQDEQTATYTPLLTKKDAWLNLAKPAEILERQIRAFSLWPKSKLRLGDKDITILKAQLVATQNDSGLIIACGGNTFLEITELIAPSGKTISGLDFLRGYTV